MFARLLENDPSCPYLSTLIDYYEKDARSSATVIHHHYSQRCDDARVSMTNAIYAKYQCKWIYF